MTGNGLVILGTAAAGLLLERGILEGLPAMAVAGSIANAAATPVTDRCWIIKVTWGSATSKTIAILKAKNNPFFDREFSTFLFAHYSVRPAGRASSLVLKFSIFFCSFCWKMSQPWLFSVSLWFWIYIPRITKER